MLRTQQNTALVKRAEDTALSTGHYSTPLFTSLHSIAGPVFEHMSVEPVVIQKLYMRATLLVFSEDLDVERICTTLPSVEIWLGHNVTVTCAITTPKQLTMIQQLRVVGTDEVASWDDGNVLLFRSMPDPLHGTSYPSVAPLIEGKTLKYFSGETAQEGSFCWRVGVWVRCV